jgi:hypothetical protein
MATFGPWSLHAPPTTANTATRQLEYNNVNITERMV